LYLRANTASNPSSTIQGVEAYKRREFAEAVEWYRRASDQGHALAQFNLALMYDKGQGVPQNDAAAVNWYRKAADQGDVRAQCNLAAKYTKGRGVPQDYATAAGVSVVSQFDCGGH
jgi:TPR repeat protein